MEKIIRNAARCKLCGDIIESTYRHDFKTCRCGNLSVDGGHDYIRRGFRDHDRCSYEDLNIIEGANDEFETMPPEQQAAFRAVNQEWIDGKMSYNEWGKRLYALRKKFGMPDILDDLRKVKGEE